MRLCRTRRDHKMQNKLIRFFVQQDGAVTVDWVVLTAAIVGLGFAVLVPIGSGTQSASAGVASYIQDVDVGYVED
jgi:hypothetical protein